MYGFGSPQEALFQKDLNTFAQANGFTVKYTHAGSWDTEIRSRVAGGNPPDVGLFPQPGHVTWPSRRRSSPTATPTSPP